MCGHREMSLTSMWLSSFQRQRTRCQNKLWVNCTQALLRPGHQPERPNSSQGGPGPAQVHLHLSAPPQSSSHCQLVPLLLSGNCLGHMTWLFFFVFCFSLLPFQRIWHYSTCPPKNTTLHCLLVLPGLLLSLPPPWQARLTPSSRLLGTLQSSSNTTGAIGPVSQLCTRQEQGSRLGS